MARDKKYELLSDNVDEARNLQLAQSCITVNNLSQFSVTWFSESFNQYKWELDSSDYGLLRFVYVTIANAAVHLYILCTNIGSVKLGLW